MSARLLPLVALGVIGAAWGITTPLTKIAVSSGHHPFGLLMWVALIDSCILAAICLATGRRPGLSAAHLQLYAMVAVFGMVLPQVFSYTAAAHLPGGVLALVVSLVPLIALPVALVVGLERFRARRALGLVFGLAAIVVILGPDTSLPDRAAAAFLLVGALAPLCYAIESVYLDGWGTRASDPVETLAGAAPVAALVAVPLAVLSGHAITPFRVWEAPEFAIVASALVSVFAYCGYVWLVRAGGAVFSGQVAYVVTASGVMWSMILLGERFGPWFWLALMLLFAGVVLVRPREAADGAAAVVVPAQTGRRR